MRYIALYTLLLSLLLNFSWKQSRVYALEYQAAQDFPQVDRNYVYNQLFTLVTKFQHREAGYDNNQSANAHGHNGFAKYWSQEMLKNLQGFGAQVQRDPCDIQGWSVRPARAPAFNVEVTVPGILSDQILVVRKASKHTPTTPTLSTLSRQRDRVIEPHPFIVMLVRAIVLFFYFFLLFDCFPILRGKKAHKRRNRQIRA